MVKQRPPKVRSRKYSCDVSGNKAPKRGSTTHLSLPNEYYHPSLKGTRETSYVIQMNSAPSFPSYACQKYQSVSKFPLLLFQNSRAEFRGFLPALIFTTRLIPLLSIGSQVSIKTLFQISVGKYRRNYAVCWWN